MPKRKTSGLVGPQSAMRKKRGTPSRSGAVETHNGPELTVEQPFWDAASGELSWRGQGVLVLAKHAHSERAVLCEFQRFDWRWVVASPLRRAPIGDPTQELRHAIFNLNKHQPKETIHFFSVRGGFLGWCDAHRLCQSDP